MSEPTQYIVFVNGANIGIVNSMSEANMVVGAYVGRNPPPFGSGGSKIQVKDSKTYQVVNSWHM